MFRSILKQLLPSFAFCSSYEMIIMNQLTLFLHFFLFLDQCLFLVLIHNIYFPQALMLVFVPFLYTVYIISICASFLITVYKKNTFMVNWQANSSNTYLVILIKIYTNKNFCHFSSFQIVLRSSEMYKVTRKMYIDKDV